MRGPRRPLRAAAVAVGLATALTAASCTDDGGASAEAFCRELATAPSLDTVLTGYTAADEHDLADRLDDASDAYADVRDAAPSDIRDETGAVVDLVDEVLGAVRDHHDDPEAVATRLRAAVAEHPDAQDASTTLVEWAAERCELDLGSPLGPGGPEGVTTTTIAGDGS